MSTVEVTFTGLPVEVVSRARGAAGTKHNFDLTTMVQVGTGDSLALAPHHQEGVRVTGKATATNFRLPASMAGRLEHFVRTCLVPAKPPRYSGHGFVNYLLGYTTSPTTQDEGYFVTAGPKVRADKVQWGAAYPILAESHTPVGYFVGLGPNLCFAVAGINGKLGVRPVDSLVQAYGGKYMQMIVGHVPG